GEQQRVALTGGALGEHQLANRRAGASTLVLITHDPELAAQCDRIIEMRDGKIVHDSSVAADSGVPA
ncbi:MAG TPA: hypothetical protein PK808_10805, partial [Polymorphobacter sp.]|nr:hypothetical protein [Polymorphobacter sp.]